MSAGPQKLRYRIEDWISTGHTHTKTLQLELPLYLGAVRNLRNYYSGYGLFLAALHPQP